LSPDEDDRVVHPSGLPLDSPPDYEPCQALGAGLAAGTGGRDPCGGHRAQPAVCPGRGEGRALPGPWPHAGAEHPLDGTSNSLPQKARCEATSAGACDRTCVRHPLKLLDTHVDRPPSNAVTFYAVLQCVYYGLQTRVTGCGAVVLIVQWPHKRHG